MRNDPIPITPLPFTPAVEAFSAPDAKQFLSTVKLLAGTTDKAPGLKKALSTALQGIEKAVESLGGKSGTLIALGGHRETNVLGETYYTQTPMLYGDYINRARKQAYEMSKQFRAERNGLPVAEPARDVAI